MLRIAFSGISEMYKTPVNERKRRSVINESSAMKTPGESLGTSVVEPSVLNTPEEPGEVLGLHQSMKFVFCIITETKGFVN